MRLCEARAPTKIDSDKTSAHNYCQMLAATFYIDMSRRKIEGPE